MTNTEATATAILDFKNVSRREFTSLGKAQAIARILHDQGFGVRINSYEKVVFDALGNEILRKPSSSVRVTLTSNASWDTLNQAVRTFEKAAEEVSVEAVMAKLAQN